MRELHRKDAYEAALGLSALFRGEETDDAIAAGIGMAEWMAYSVAYIKARAKAK